MTTGVILISMSAFAFIFWTIQIVDKDDRDWSFSKWFCGIAVSGYSASMFASSFIEEEGYTWYYITQTIGMLSVIHR